MHAQAGDEVQGIRRTGEDELDRLLELGRGGRVVVHRQRRHAGDLGLRVGERLLGLGDGGGRQDNGLFEAHGVVELEGGRVGLAGRELLLLDGGDAGAEEKRTHHAGALVAGRVLVAIELSARLVEPALLEELLAEAERLFPLGAGGLLARELVLGLLELVLGAGLLREELGVGAGAGEIEEGLVAIDRLLEVREVARALEELAIHVAEVEEERRLGGEAVGGFEVLEGLVVVTEVELLFADFELLPSECEQIRRRLRGPRRRPQHGEREDHEQHRRGSTRRIDPPPEVAKGENSLEGHSVAQLSVGADVNTLAICQQATRRACAPWGASSIAHGKGARRGGISLRIHSRRRRSHAPAARRARARRRGSRATSRR